VSWVRSEDPLTIGMVVAQIIQAGGRGTPAHGHQTGEIAIAGDGPRLHGDQVDLRKAAAAASAVEVAAHSPPLPLN
jgi:hypothetical protein